MPEPHRRRRTPSPARSARSAARTARASLSTGVALALLALRLPALRVPRGCLALAGGSFHHAPQLLDLMVGRLVGQTLDRGIRLTYPLPERLVGQLRERPLRSAVGPVAWILLWGCRAVTYHAFGRGRKRPGTRFTRATNLPWGSCTFGSEPYSTRPAAIALATSHSRQTPSPSQRSACASAPSEAYTSGACLIAASSAAAPSWGRASVAQPAAPTPANTP